jgi:hypothetical protein
MKVAAERPRASRQFQAGATNWRLEAIIAAYVTIVLSPALARRGIDLLHPAAANLLHVFKG